MTTDEQIQRDVMDELRWEPAITSTDIGVSVRDGIVTLSGQVRFYAEKLAAEKATKRVKGVKAVAEDIEVRLSDDKVSDTDLAASILQAFQWSSAVPEDKVLVRVDDGWVLLEGEVEQLFQKEAAVKAIRFLHGIKGISNHISVRPMLEAVDLKESIRKALERSADLEADGISIETYGNKVVLRGTARSWKERKEVQRAAAAAPGVTEVDDQLVIR